MATGFQHITNSNDNIIKAVRSEAQALLTISHTLFNQTRTIERDLACRSYAQDLFTATRQEILDLRLHKTPRHVLNDLIEVLDLHRWFSSEKMKNVKYSELLSTIMMYTGNECIGCIGFFATFPLIHPDQVYPNSTNIRSIGMVVKDQVIKWDHFTGYMTLKGTETLFTSRTCCHETHNYVVCTCNTLQPFSPNDSKLISVESLHGHSNAIQVSHTQWCVISEMNSFTYGGLTCAADHSFCLEVTEDFSMGQIDILGRMPKDAEVSPWWDDTFYEHGTQALIDTMDLVQNVILQTEYHLTTTEVTLQGSLWVAQTVPKGGTVRLVPMCLGPPPPREDAAHWGNPQNCLLHMSSRTQHTGGIHKTVSCICHPGRSTLGESTKLSLAYIIQDAAHWGVHTLYWRSTRWTWYRHHSPLPSPPRIHWKPMQYNVYKKVTIHVWYLLKCLSAPGKMVSFSQS